MIALTAGVGAVSASDTDLSPVTDTSQVDKEESVQAGGSTLTATSASDSNTISASDSESSFGEQAVAITVAPTGGSFSLGETMPIFVGAVNNDAAPVGENNVELTVTVTAPNGQTEEFNRTTDDDGSAKVVYDLDNAQEGVYAVSVNGYEEETATVYPTVGSTVTEIEDFGEMPVNKNTDIDFLVKSGEESVANELVNISVEAPNGTIIDRLQERSGGDGFVTVSSFSPNKTGSYEFTAKIADASEAPNSRAQTRIDVDVSEIIVRNGYRLDDAIANKTFSYGGYIKDADGLIRDSDFVVELVNRTDFDDKTTVTSRQVSTDSNGFFTTDFTADQNAESYDVIVKNVNGDEVYSENIFVDGADDTEVIEDDVNLNIETSKDTVVPGEQITYDVSATADGESISNASVSVLGRLDFRGAPVASDTDVTDSTGSASLTLAAPSGINGTDLDGEVHLRFNGTTYEEDLPFTEINTYEIDPDPGYDEDDTVGGSAEISLTVKEIRSGDPVAGVPLQFNALYEDDSYDSFERGELVTGEDGTASQSISVPRNVGPVPAIGLSSRGGQPTYVNMYEYPGSASITGVEQDTATPGETLTVEFTTPDSQPASGIVIAEFEDGTAEDFSQANIATDIDTSSTATINVPQWAAGTNAEIEVWMADSNGNFYDDREFFDISGQASNPGTGVTVPSAFGDEYGDVSAKSYSAVLAGEDRLGAGNLAAAIRSWAGDDGTERGSIDGTSVDAGELSAMINYWATEIAG